MRDDAAGQRRRAARDYYDQTTTLYLRHLGTTLQAGFADGSASGWGGHAIAAHNLLLARRAGLRGDETVLDAGCGVCGPAMDMAMQYPELAVIGITISGIQARRARRLVEQAALSSRVHVLQGDFHCLPVGNAQVDAVMYLESAGYSHDQAELFSEARRVLPRAGTVYVKDVFVRSARLSERQASELLQFDELFAYSTRRIEETLDCLRRAGLRAVRVADLSAMMSTRPFVRAMFDGSRAGRALNEFGRRHFRNLEAVPLYFADILATC